MDMASVAANPNKKEYSNNESQKTIQRCLLFDRRYGFVYDVWKDPSEEALSGGRGMFCIAPLANALIKSASHTINRVPVVVDSIFKGLEKPHLFTPEAIMQMNINSQLQRVASCVKKPEFSLDFLMRNQPLHSHPRGERRESHTVEIA